MNYVIMKLSKLSFLCIVLLIFGCSRSVVRNTNIKQNDVRSSILIDEKDFLRDTIYVGDIITNRPLTSQVISADGHEKYLLLDQNKLYRFDWETGVVEDTIDMSTCGNLDNYSGFNYINKDSIYVYNYNMRTLYLINDKGQVKNNRSNLKDFKKADYEALNKTRIISAGTYVVMSGGKLGDISDRDVSDRVVSQKIEFNNRKPRDIMSYPDIYNNGFWGGVYMNELSHTLVDDNNIVYSFSIDHYVRMYNLHTGISDSIYMGSKYIDAITSSSDNPIDLFMDKDARIVYYTKEHSYGNILYDKYRGLILRFASHPLPSYDGGMFIKPFSIIAYDLKSKELSESAIFKNYSNLNTSNMHICKEGIAIASFDNADETKIVFKIFKYKKQ